MTPVMNNVVMEIACNVTVQLSWDQMHCSFVFHLKCQVHMVLRWRYNLSIIVSQEKTWDDMDWVLVLKRSLIMNEVEIGKAKEQSKRLLTRDIDSKSSKMRERWAENLSMLFFISETEFYNSSREPAIIFLPHIKQVDQEISNFGAKRFDPSNRDRNWNSKRLSTRAAWLWASSSEETSSASSLLENKSRSTPENNLAEGCVQGPVDRG